MKRMKNEEGAYRATKLINLKLSFTLHALLAFPLVESSVINIFISMDRIAACMMTWLLGAMNSQTIIT